ncbi:MAG: hypothetical protein PHH58_04470, partial [Rhodoferax sp.]|nr:hypothetical protein [Rhodoferax sp.]
TSVWNIPKRTADEGDEPSTALGKNVLYKSMMDCELVLRFFAIRDAAAGTTKGSLRQIFDRTMQRYSSLSEPQVAIMKADFLSAITRTTAALGYNFHVLPSNQQLSRPLYDAILVAAHEQQGVDLSNHADEIRRRLADALANQDEYEILVGRGNTLESIKARVALATKILVG